MKTSSTLIAILIGLFFWHPGLSQQDGFGLKEMFKDAFHIGTAISYRQASGEEQQAWPILEKHFNSITAENMMKWGPIHPEPDIYNFGPADQFVKLGKKLNAFIIGHTLVWHQQTPKWVYQNEQGKILNKEALLERMEKHIETLVGRYKGQVHGWDVVNEVFEDDGSYRASEWYQITGRDYIFRAFQKAYEMDPEAELYYNDYNLWKPEKRAAAIALAQELREKGLRVDGIGMQGHYMLESPPVEMIEASIIAISNAGFKVMITELDVDVLPRPRASEGADLNKNYALDEKYNPYSDGLPKDITDKFTNRYTDIFSVLYKHRDKVSRVTFWGLHDGASWLNNWPVSGRTNYPLLFDNALKEKEEVIKSISKVIVSNFCQSQGVKVALCDAWAKGGEGAIELAQKVKAAAESGMSNFTPLYDFEWGIEQKIESIARKIYGAAEVEYSVKAKQQMRLFVKIGLDKLPVCIAKTQYSLSDDPKLINKPTGFTIKIREFDIAAGAGFIIPIAGTIMRMPGLPSRPAAENIDIDADGNITGLF